LTDLLIRRTFEARPQEIRIMPHLSSRFRPLSRSAIGLLLLVPAALFTSASLLKYAAGFPVLYDGLGFLAEPRQLPWYERASPFLFLGGPLLAAMLSLGAIVRLEIRKEADEVITTVTLRPRFLNLAVATLSLIVLGVLAGYAVAENLGHS
jgi:hypothetical protein